MSALWWRWRDRLGLRRRGADLRVRLLWLAMLPVLLFAAVWGTYVIQQRADDLQAQLQQRAELLARQLAEGRHMPSGARTSTGLLPLNAFAPEFAKWDMQTDVVEENASH